MPFWKGPPHVAREGDEEWVSFAKETRRRETSTATAEAILYCWYLGKTENETVMKLSVC